MYMGYAFSRFSNPMNTPEFQIDAIDCLSDHYDLYDDTDFVRRTKEFKIKLLYRICIMRK